MAETFRYCDTNIGRVIQRVKPNMRGGEFAYKDGHLLGWMSEFRKINKGRQGDCGGNYSIGLGIKRKKKQKKSKKYNKKQRKY